MRFSFLVSVSVILVLGLGLLISGASLADREDASRARAETLVLGFLECDDFVPGDGRRRSNARWGFEGWEGVGRWGETGTQSGPATFLESLGNFGETCRGLTQEIQSVAHPLPVTVATRRPCSPSPYQNIP